MSSPHGRTWADLLREFIYPHGHTNPSVFRMLVLLLVFPVIVTTYLIVSQPEAVGKWLENAPWHNEDVPDEYVEPEIGQDGEVIIPPHEPELPNNQADVPIPTEPPIASSHDYSQYIVSDYSRKIEKEKVEQVIRNLGFQLDSGAARSEARPVSNIWFDQKTVDTAVVKALAKSLVSEGVQILSIQPFKHSDKRYTLELGSYDETLSTCHHVWTQEDIDAVSSFSRNNDGCLLPGK